MWFCERRELGVLLTFGSYAWQQYWLAVSVASQGSRASMICAYPNHHLGFFWVESCSWLTLHAVQNEPVNKSPKLISIKDNGPTTREKHWINFLGTAVASMIRFVFHFSAGWQRFHVSERRRQWLSTRFTHWLPSNYVSSLVTLQLSVDNSPGLTGSRVSVKTTARSSRRAPNIFSIRWIGWGKKGIIRLKR